jgi:HipA-like protein
MPNMFTSRFHKGPPPTLQVIYLDTVVAELTKKISSTGTIYAFRYLPAFKTLNLAPLPGLPYSEATRESHDLWPFFAERIPDARRPEVKALMNAKQLDPDDEFRLLAELGSRSITDPFEIKFAA